MRSRFVVLAVSLFLPIPNGSFAQQHAPLEYSKWSGSINVPDPVAISVDNQGRVFITQTRRRKIQDLDIRQNSDWIPGDVALSSVQEKSDFLKQKLAIGGDQTSQAKRVQDLNQDGQFDWRDLRVVSEAIYRLTDDDGDGTADQIVTFAEGFNSEVTGIAAGVLAHGDKVYATIAPDLWLLVDSNGDGRADARTSIAHGFGLHIAYAGHDMHGPIIGPDGRVYWSIGDKGINVVDANGKRWLYPNQGGVMRCELDGSGFEVYAHGLRNVQEFDFDQYGNMFGIDNDADKPGERERFVWIVRDMDAGWRCNYQYRGEDYNPWTDEGLWKVQIEGDAKNDAEIELAQAASYLVPPISHYIDGPAGFKFNPGTALSADYRDYFFSTGAPEGIQHAFRVEAVGDSFKMVDDHRIGSGVAIVGIAFGPDGGLYGADWDGGYPLDQKGSVAKIDVPANKRNPARQEVQQLLNQGFADTPTQNLVTLLSHEDRRIRAGAQFELVERDEMYPLASTALDTAASTTARLHGLWGVAMLGRRGTETFPRDTLGGLLRDADEHIRAAAAQEYAEMPRAYGFALVPLLKDKSLKVRIRAGIALGRLPANEAKKSLLEAAAELKPTEHYLRHSIVSAMASCIEEAALAELSTNEHEATRLCAVLALRRLASPETHRFLKDASDKVATAAARAIHDDMSIEGAMESLALVIEGDFDNLRSSEAFVRRSINANFRLGTAAAAQRLARFAASDSVQSSYRQTALAALAQWLSPPPLDLVDGRARQLDNSDRLLPEQPIVHHLGKIIEHGPADLQASAMRTATSLGLELSLQTLTQLLGDKDVAGDTRAAALAAIVNQSGQFVVDSANSDPAVQLTAAELLPRLAKDQQQSFIDRILNENKVDPRVMRAVIRFLGTDASEFSLAKLVHLVDQSAKGELPSALALDIALAGQARSIDNQSMAKLLSQGEKVTEDAELATYGLAIIGGDSANGKRIFNSHVEAQCSRCHRAGGSGSNIGPDLAKVVKKRDDKHLLRSLLKPSSDIEPKYQSQSFLLYSGNVVQGVPVRETGNSIVVADKDGKEVEIDKDDIEESIVQKNSLMPEMSKVLNPVEIRDLLAFLRSL